MPKFVNTAGLKEIDKNARDKHWLALDSIYLSQLDPNGTHVVYEKQYLGYDMMRVQFMLKLSDCNDMIFDVIDMDTDVFLDLPVAS